MNKVNFYWRYIQLDKLSFSPKTLGSKVKEYLKFNVVGMANFAVSQILYLTLYLYFKIDYIIAYTFTSILSVTASYFLNSKFTFKDKHYSLKKYILSFLVYAFEYGLYLVVILLFVNIFHLSKAIAPIIAPAFSTIPVFFLMRLVIKHTNKK